MPLKFSNYICGLGFIPTETGCFFLLDDESDICAILVHKTYLNLTSV